MAGEEDITKEQKNELNEGEEGEGNPEDAAKDAAPAAFDFGEKKKKKKKKKKEEPSAQAEEEQIIDGTGNVFIKGEVYEYEELLNRLNTMASSINQDLRGSRKYVLRPPGVVRVGSKKCAWINFRDLCFTMNRGEEHVQQFVMSELGTNGSIAYDGQLVLKGRYTARSVEGLLRKYITEYVTCQMCKSACTTMERDSRTRLYTQKCSVCGANRSVATIKSGFHAFASRERRKAVKSSG